MSTQKPKTAASLKPKLSAKPTSTKLPSAKSKDQWVTREPLFAVRDELVLKIDSLAYKADGHDSRFEQIDARFDEMQAHFNYRFDTLMAEVAGMRVLLEEQNSNNRIVLEGLQALWQRQTQTEIRLDHLESKL